MTTRQLLELLGRVSDEHQRYEPGAGEPPTQVIPVLLDGAAGFSGLIRAFAEHHGGVLLDVTGKDFSLAVPARRDDPELRAAIEASLTVTNLGARRHVRIDVEAGSQVDAEFLVDDEPQVATGGWAKILAIGRALFAASLDASAFGVLLYREGELDVTLGPKVLRTLCDIEKASIRLGSLRTLVVVVDASSLSVADHCQPGSGVRYALLEDGPQYRKPIRQLRGSVQRFVQPRDKPVVLFLGAGFSASSHLPMGNTLRDQTIARMTGLDLESHSSDSLAIGLFEFAESNRLLLPSEQGLGREEFARKLTLEHVVRMESKYFDRAIPQTIEEFAQLHQRAIDQDSIGAAVLHLRSLVSRRARLILITVNFDELLEQPPDNLDVAVTPDEFEAITPTLRRLVNGQDVQDDRVPYLKLHGSIGSPETCVASDDQTLTGLDIAKRSALEALVRDASGDPLLWVYVGASMRDLDLKPVFEMREFHQSVEEYWASPYIEPSVKLFAATRAHSWTADRGLEERMITEVADRFLEELSASWVQ